MNMSAQRLGAGLLLSVLALSLAGCKNNRNESAENDHKYNEVGEMRVFDTPRQTVVAPSRKVNVVNAPAREVAVKSKFVRIGEMDMDN